MDPDFTLGISCCFVVEIGRIPDDEFGSYSQ